MMKDINEVVIFNKLAELVTKYSEDKRFADNTFIQIVCTIIANHLNLEDELKYVNVDHYSKMTCYNPISNSITINPKFNHNSSFRRYLNSDEYIYWYNLSILQTLLHELEHARQEHVKKHGKMSIEKKLIVLNDPIVYIHTEEENKNFSLGKRIKNQLIANRYYKYYRRNHDLSPVERMANLKSASQLNRIREDIPNNERDGIKAYIVKTYLDFLRQLSHGYKLVGNLTNSPSLEYLSNMKNTINRMVINNDKTFINNNLDFQDRLLYGLYLTESEYKSLDNLDILKK